MAAPAASRWIVGPRADAFLLIGAPVLALAFAYLASIDGLAALKILIVISPAHLFLVLFRSHGNATVFRRFPYRFTLVPLALFAALLTSTTIFTLVFYVTLLWDVHHGYMQTFGLCRIYDAKAGNPPTAGRRLDMALNGLLYLGPLVSGAWMLRYVELLSGFDLVAAIFFSQTVPAFVDGHQGDLMRAAIVLGAAFLAFYVWFYARLARRGHQVSPQKVALLVSTGVVSIWAWGFNPYGMGFFVINFFHAIQYFTIVYWSERKQLLKRLRLDASPRGPALLLLLVLLPSMLFGITMVSLQGSVDTSTVSFAYGLLCAGLVLETMHYWWDGFIWSVRKKDVDSLVAPSAASAPAPQAAVDRAA